MNDDSQTLLRTALLDCHRAANARLVPFAGWEMPVQYSGVIPEVRAVREGCGIFDVSHMGQLSISGEGATEALNRALSNDWSDVGIGRVAYSLLLNEQGGVLDDVMGYRLGEDEWLVVVNASRAENDEAVLRERLPGLKLENSYDDQAMLAVQGPRAEEVLAALDLSPSPSEITWRDCVKGRFQGREVLVARGGYTGSDGFEIMCDVDIGILLWQKLVEAGAVPCGLGARDVLRLEAGLPLYGHELREEWTPYESGCGFAIKMDKEYFVGQEALRNKRTPARVIKALQMQARAIPREGYKVLRDGVEIGEVTSGTMSPTVEAGIALAMLPRELQPGDEVDVLVRDKPQPAQIVKKPFVPHARK